MIKIVWGQKEAGKLYKAKILDRCPTDDSDWTYLVHYIGWNDAYDDWIFTSDIHSGLLLVVSCTHGLLKSFSSFSVVESYNEPSKVEENVPDCNAANDDYTPHQGVSLLDEKFYMPGSSRSTVPFTMLTEKNGIKLVLFQKVEDCNLHSDELA